MPPPPVSAMTNNGDLVATACEKAKGHEAHHYLRARADGVALFDYLECAGRVMDAAGDCWQRVSYEDGALKRALWNDAVDVANRANLAQALIEQMVDFPDDHEYRHVNV
ncbi:unnamed protein product [Miscanthus lutarioriparius]|uniref:Uncharacterized protein n=1 Tax=Miscanthus lutarioriparius TaxID=422564 RepID=A0A811SBT5_9POAL|nr:unnamed protein product [Miscanthus lutarioriparius]